MTTTGLPEAGLVLATQDICSQYRGLKGKVVSVKQAPLNGCLM
jgi:hypothetical protein